MRAGCELWATADTTPEDVGKLAPGIWLVNLPVYR